MRYPTESDFSQDKVYSSSRLAPEEIALTSEEGDEVPISSGSERPIPTTATVVPQTATLPQSSKKESRRRRDGDGDKEKRTPSFLSRSYIAWKTLANRGVYTPVESSKAYDLIFLGFNRLSSTTSSFSTSRCC